MYGYGSRKRVTKELAIGIKGHLSSLCGAMKRFKHNGAQWNGFLSLKEQCARRIVRLNNEQLKCFILAYLPPSLFQYVTKDIFNLRRDELVSKRAKRFRLCDRCTVDSNDEPAAKCRCPDLDGAMKQLNKSFFKRMNPKKETNKDQLKAFDLTYRVPYDEGENWKYERPLFYCMYLSPSQYNSTTDDEDMDESITFQSHEFLNGQISVEEKLLFVDVLRVFGGFHSEHEQPQLILSERCEIDR